MILFNDYKHSITPFFDIYLNIQLKLKYQWDFLNQDYYTTETVKYEKCDEHAQECKIACNSECLCFVYIK